MRTTSRSVSGVGRGSPRAPPPARSKGRAEFAAGLQAGAGQQRQTARAVVEIDSERQGRRAVQVVAQIGDGELHARGQAWPFVHDGEACPRERLTDSPVRAGERAQADAESAAVIQGAVACERRASACISSVRPETPTRWKAEASWLAIVRREVFRHAAICA